MAKTPSLEFYDKLEAEAKKEELNDLRDAFAIAALQGILAGAGVQSFNGYTKHAGEMASISYLIANAMLQEKQNQEK